jgi:hypothetical protein
MSGCVKDVKLTAGADRRLGSEMVKNSPKQTEAHHMLTGPDAAGSQTMASVHGLFASDVPCGRIKRPFSLLDPLVQCEETANPGLQELR